MAGRDTARAIVVRGDQLLLMERWRDELHYFSVPGGGIEPGETPEQTVLRELLEETSIVATIQRQVLQMELNGGQNYLFLCSYVSGEPALAPNAPERNSGPNNRFAPQWIAISQLSEISLGVWEPLKAALLQGLQEGFSDSVLVVR